MTTILSGGERWVTEESKKIQLPYEPFPKQAQFHSSPAKYRLFGGSAGPGKSKALLMEAVLQAHEHAGVNTLLLRRTFPELEQSLLLYFRRDVPRELYRTYNESKHLVEWWNGSTTKFGYCQSENDVYQYQGAEFLFIGIDELTLFTLRQWQFLTSRNRCPVGGAFPCMAGATNPGNIGHAWVKSLWVDKQPAAGMDAADQYDPCDYDFIAARVHDNPIYASDENYIKTLRSLPSHLRRAFLDGEWDVFAGQYFDRFDYSRHVINLRAVNWQEWWHRWVSLDWGFEHPAAVYWHAVIPGGYSQLPPGKPNQASPPCDSSATDSRSLAQVVTYREYVTHRTPPRELAREIVARSGSSGSRERIDAVYLSPDAFARRTDEASIAEQMGDVLADAGLPRPIPADDDRIGGWMLMYQMLDTGEWVLTENCSELIHTLPNLIRDPGRIEDVQKMDGDDAADAARYGLKSRYRARVDWRNNIPIDQRLASRMTSADPTVRAIQARKAQIEESRRTLPVSFLRRRH